MTLRRVTRLLTEYVGVDIGDPVEHPVVLRTGTAAVHVRILDAQPPVLRVFSRLLAEVPRSDALVVELNELNATLSFVRVFWRDDAVFAATELLASTLDLVELAAACDLVADVADYYDVRLRDRHGGSTAFD
jgi:hypothetical protein